jgi:tRNA(Arg) A34 adenosine deaminase TadA
VNDPDPQLDLNFLRRAIEVSQRARWNGNHPFGAVLVVDGKIVLEAENTVTTTQDCTGHAETNLMRVASTTFTPDVLSRATLYSSCEPCAMCSGAIYWGGVNRVVYALSEERLYELTGANPANPTLKLPCREVLTRGQRQIEIIGPALETEAQVAHEHFWTND